MSNHPQGLERDSRASRTNLRGVVMCHAKDEHGNKRYNHKPAEGMYDGRIIVSCVWCGKILEEK